MQITREQQLQTRHQMAEFINQHRWDYMVTLTHRYAGSEERQLRELRAMIRRLERVAQRPVAYVAFAERTTVGHLHHHLLLHGIADVPKRMLRRQWKAGYTKADRYDRQRDGGRYVSKAYATEHPPELQLSDVLPPRWTDAVVESAVTRQRRTGRDEVRRFRQRRYGRGARRTASQTVAASPAPERPPARRRPALTSGIAGP